eukprot:13346422-Heterocapsa_arctica.AAC.1
MTIRYRERKRSASCRRSTRTLLSSSSAAPACRSILPRPQAAGAILIHNLSQPGPRYKPHHAFSCRRRWSTRARTSQSSSPRLADAPPQK